jgi:hypothetical protein
MLTLLTLQLGFGWPDNTGHTKNALYSNSLAFEEFSLWSALSPYHFLCDKTYGVALSPLP